MNAGTLTCRRPALFSRHRYKERLIVELYGIFRDLAGFIAALWREWKILLTGGTIMALVAIWALGTNRALPYNFGWLVLGLTFIAAAFMSWRRAHLQTRADRQSYQSELQRREQKIQALNSQLAQKPTLPPDELEKRRRVQTLIANATAEEIEFLKFILDREEIPYEHGYHDRSREAVDNSIAKWRHKLIDVRIEHGRNATFWSIVPGLKDALVYVLYEQLPKP